MNDFIFEARPQIRFERVRSLLTALLVGVLFLTALLTLPAHADSGPKPSVRVTFENMGSEVCYGTLLSEKPSTGPFSAWNGNADELYTYLDDLPDDVWLAFTYYEDADGFYFLQNAVWQVDKSKELLWSYYPPERFKVLLYYPETGRFAVSAVCERYAFDSYFTVDIAKTDAAVLNVRRSYQWQHEVLSLIARIAVTIAVELLIALLFGFRSKKELLLILLVNVVTQIVLNVLLNVINFNAGLFGFIIGYVLLEFAIIVLEAVIYSTRLRKLSDKARPVWLYALYALAANVASFAAGMAIAYVVPGIF